MIIKESDDRQGELVVLERLLVEARGTTSYDLIYSDIQAIKRGVIGEKDVVYHLQSHYRNDTGTLLLNDLRLEIDGQGAQIDHVVLTRSGIAYMLETKAHRGRLMRDETGQWHAIYGRGPTEKKFTISCPIAQSQRHMKAIVDLMRPFNTKLKRVQPVIVVRSDADIDPDLRKTSSIPIIGCDRLPQWIEEQGVLATPRIEGEIQPTAIVQLNDDELLGISLRLIRAHQLGTQDLRGRYGLPAAAAPATAPANDTGGQGDGDAAQGASRYVGRYIRRSVVETVDGAFAVRQHEDDMRTIQAVGEDVEFRKAVSRCCKRAGGIWIEQDKAWLLSFDACNDVVNDLSDRQPAAPYADEPAPAPVEPAVPFKGESVLRQVSGNGKLLEATTPDGPVRFFQMPDNRYAVRTDGVVMVDMRVQAACAGLGEWYPKYSNWILPNDRNLVEKVARIMADLEVRNPDDMAAPKGRQIDGRHRRRGDGQDRPEKVQARR